jgi:hypothetical protein
MTAARPANKLQFQLIDKPLSTLGARAEHLLCRATIKVRIRATIRVRKVPGVG